MKIKSIMRYPVDIPQDIYAKVYYKIPEEYLMNCKYCHSENIVKNGKVKGKQVFKCKDCKKRFTANGKFAKMRTDKNIIVAAINLYYDGLSLRKTQQNLKRLFGENVSQVTILNWLKKYSLLVKEYVKTLVPQLSGLWHEDETMLAVEGRNIWFWEMIDEDTKFLVSSHLSNTRTLKDTIAIFQKGLDQSKVKPRAVFVDGCNAYNRAFNKVFYSRYKADRVELVQRVGIRTRETNNIVERLHGTLKDRTKPMRGLKDFDSTNALLEGYTVHYNFVREHQSLLGKTPAQAARTEAPNNWKGLIEEATKYEAELFARVTEQKIKENEQTVTVVAK